MTASVYWWSAAAGTSATSAAPVDPAPPTAADPPRGCVDVAVIGAGYAGLSIAEDLLAAAPGCSVSVLDARFPGFGASGRNAGGVLSLGMLPWLLPGAAGRDDGAALLRDLHTRVTDRMTDLRDRCPAGEARREPMLVLGDGRLLAAGLDRVADAVLAAGLTAQRWPGVRARAAGSPRVRLGVLLDAWTIQPAGLATALAERVAAAGAPIHGATPVAGLESGPDGVTVHLADGGRLLAGRVVVATGAYTPALALPDPPKAAVVHTYLRASTPLPPEEVARLGGTGLFRTAPGPGMPYWRLHGDRLLFGGTDVAGLTPGPAADASGRAHRTVDRLHRRHLPAHRADVAYRWGGPIHVTPTETPHVAASAADPRIVYAVGFAGSGVALALTCGPLVRDLVLGPASADPPAVRLRTAMNATRVPVSTLLSFGLGTARRLFTAGQ